MITPNVLTFSMAYRSSYTNLIFISLISHVYIVELAYGTRLSE